MSRAQIGTISLPKRQESEVKLAIVSILTTSSNIINKSQVPAHTNWMQLKLQTDRIPFLPTSNQTTTQKQYISSLFF